MKVNSFGLGDWLNLPSRQVIGTPARFYLWKEVEGATYHQCQGKWRSGSANFSLYNKLLKAAKSKQEFIKLFDEAFDNERN